MSEAALAWRAEAAFRAAWPAHEEIALGDWCLRFARGVSRRANSVNALRPVAGNIDEIIANAEGAYRQRQLRPIFRITSLIDPAIDRQLAEAGYALEGASRTLHIDLPPGSLRRDPDMRILTRPDFAWFAAMGRLQGWDTNRLDLYRSIVARIEAQSESRAAFFMLLQERAAVAMAFAVIHDGIACVESVVTDREQRRQGHGRRLLGALLAWAIEQGAVGAALQVEAGNAPALALYRSMGFFNELQAYHYRVKA